MAHVDSYIHNYARTLSGKLHLKSHDFRYSSNAVAIARAIVDQCWGTIWNEVYRETWKTRTNLAGEGVGKKFGGSDQKKRVGMFEVHTTEWIVLEWDGPAFITQLAATAVVAAIADNFWDECERQREVSRSFLAERGCTYQS